MKTAVADERGRYRIEHCNEGSYWVTPSDTSALSFPHATASAGSTAVDFTATRHQYLTGIVVDEQKRPVGGATVQYSQPQFPLLYGNVSHETLGSARSGRDGRFKLPLSEEMRTYASKVPLRLRALRRGYALAVSNDLDLEKSVTLTLPSGIELQGVVVDANGDAVAGAGVVAIQDPYGAVPLPLDLAIKAGTLAPFVESDAEGRFTLRLNPAQHDFGVWKEGRGAARVSLDVAPGAGLLKVVLERGVAIRGRVIAPGAETIGGRIVANGETMTLGYADVADDGTFTVDEIRPGTYTLQYMNQETGRQAQVSAKAPSEGVTIELPASGTIRGRVVDRATQEVLRSYTVTPSTRYQPTFIEDEESFTLDLPPGDVELKIEAKGYQDATQQVTVAAGKTEEILIFVNRGRVVSGRVTNEQGSPVGDAMITAEEIAGFSSSADDGTYTITLPKASVSFSVFAKGYARKELELPADSGEHLDIVLSRGKQARGHVVTHDGAPVKGAEVTAAGAGFPQEAQTDDNGSFVVEGLGDGLYTFRARRNELESEPLQNVDPAAGEIVLRMKPSAGAGAVHGRVKGFTEGGWMVGFVQAGQQHAMIGRDGGYRFEKLPAGEVELRATASGMNENASTSRPAKVTVIANGDVEADLEFNTSTVIRGTVYEDDKPAPFRSVQLYASDSHWSAQTNQNGEYTITGPEPGMNCRVLVTGNQHSFETQLQVTGSMTFDIRIAWSRIEGRVIDETGTPLAGAKIEIRPDGARDTTDTKTDGSGAFGVTIPQSDGAHAVTVELEGFATATQRAIAGGAPLLVTLQRTDGLRVRLIDARTGATLDGYAIAVDEGGHLLARAQDQKPDGTLRLPVRAGTYRIAVSASGYASQLTSSVVPRKDELRVALTPGGSLLVNTDRESNDAIKLVMPNGEEYVQCQCNGIAEIRLTGTQTEVEHVAPGTYSMQVLDARGLVKASHPITIAEGQITTIAIHIPE